MSWLVETGFVEELATATGVALLVRARLRGAVTCPYARVTRRGPRYVAEIALEKPIDNGALASIAVVLRVPLAAALDTPTPPARLRAQA